MHIALKVNLLEAVCWIAGVGLLALLEPADGHLFSLCAFSWVLEGGCPGCGLGHSIAYLFRGEWQASWEAHPLGLPALFILAYRVFALVRHYLLLKKFHLTHTYHG
nr:DUF2752 domain-containing protein [Pontibacter ruber]